MDKEELKNRLNTLKTKLDPGKIKDEIKALEKESSTAEFWQDHEKASAKMKHLSALQKEIEEIEELELVLEMGDLPELEKKLDRLEIKTFLSKPYDRSGAILSIHAGQGGVEAMDWAQMLQRMYQKYFEKKDWAFEILDQTFGEEAGVKSVTLKVVGNYAYGFLKREAGTHRLVRQSPFNADNLRQTSFALVEVLPVLEEKTVEVKEEDLDWQFFRASSKGGQNVQKVSTAVRLQHRPTGLVVTCQTERYQEQNRKIALQILTAKLWAKAEEEKEEKERQLRGGRTKATWGTQIRSYVLHPYKMVKDVRTGFETANAEAILNGDLEEMIEAEIKAVV